MADAPLRVLIVDDEAPARRRLRDLLGDCAGAMPLACVGEAANGREALELLHAVSADLVLTDIEMPEMGGLEFARHVLKLPQPPVRDLHDRARQACGAGVRGERGRLPAEADSCPAAARRAGEGAAPEAGVGARASTRSPSTARRFLSVTERSRVVLVPVEEIVYLKAELKYITIRTVEREFLLEESLTKLEEEFGLAARARPSQLPRRARCDPRLRAARRRRGRRALGGAAEGHPRDAAGVAPAAVHRPRDRTRKSARRRNRGEMIGHPAIRRLPRSSSSPFHPSSPPPCPHAHSSAARSPSTPSWCSPIASRGTSCPIRRTCCRCRSRSREMRREWGGCAGNIAYNLKALGGEPVVMATLGADGAPYRERLESLGIAHRRRAHAAADVHRAGVHHHRPRRQPDHRVPSGRDERVAREPRRRRRGHRARHRRARRPRRHAIACRAVRAGEAFRSCSILARDCRSSPARSSSR